VYCPHVDEDEMPVMLVEEGERANNRDNGDLLTKYFNEVLFRDHRVLCSTGMREYFATTTLEREKSLVEMARFRSIRSGRSGSLYGSLKIIDHLPVPSSEINQIYE
jgi:hypothetical protein